MADVVERLEAEAAHQRGVADDHRDALHSVPEVAGRGQPLRDRQACAGVPTVEDVVRRFAPPREATHAVELAERPEPLQAPGQQLVRVGLVAGVPDDLVARRFEEPMERDRQLDDAERRAEVAPRLGDRLDDGLADLCRQHGKLGIGQAAQVRRSAQVGKDGQGSGDSSEVPASLARPAWWLSAQIIDTTWEHVLQGVDGGDTRGVPHV